MGQRRQSTPRFELKLGSQATALVLVAMLMPCQLLATAELSPQATAAHGDPDEVTTADIVAQRDAQIERVNSRLTTLTAGSTMSRHLNKLLPETKRAIINELCQGNADIACSNPDELNLGSTPKDGSFRPRALTADARHRTVRWWQACPWFRMRLGQLEVRNTIGWIGMKVFNP